MVRVRLKFKKETVDQPITSKIILEQGIPINILTAHVDQDGGEILAEIGDVKTQKIVKAFREKGIIVDVRKLIEVDGRKCIDCGSCYSLCPVSR
jgi:NAD-dependent dihydropyrimidine dehydrogenase PreA subunit